MGRKIPDDAYEDYLALGTERSYQALAERYGVSKTAIVQRAKREGWQERIENLQRESQKRAESQVLDEMDKIRERQLAEARFLQHRALKALQDADPSKCGQLANALNIAWKHELLLLGEPTDRQATVEEVMRQEMRDLLKVVPDDGKGRDSA